MMRRFETTGGDPVWINDRQVAVVYGERDNVKIVMVGPGEAPVWQVRGDVRDVAVTLNGHFDD